MNTLNHAEEAELALAGFESLQDNKPSDNRPKHRDPILYRGQFAGFVSRIEGNICWLDTGNSFIWKFHDGLNNLHSWPEKDESLNCKGGVS